MQLTVIYVNKLTVAAFVPPKPNIMFTLVSTTESEKPNGFLYVANVLFDPDKGL